MYKIFGLDCFVDLSSYCNAGCPQCHRTNPEGLGKAEWLPLIQWSLDEFKTAFPRSTLQICKKLSICGTWGDPIMNKDIFEIIKYVMHNSNTRIVIDTNGSIRDEQWWWDIGVMAGDRLTVKFAVDGIDQTMHEKYRRFTNLKKVLQNMESLSNTNAHAIAQTIQFAHNQSFIKEIKNLCMSHGAEYYQVVKSDRFYSNNSTEQKYFHFTNENGEKETLEKSTIDPPNAHISGTGGKKFLEKTITCRWQHDNRVLINIDGQVLPCCYIANVFFLRKSLGYGFNDFYSHPVMKNYYERLEEHNIFKHSLSKILQTSDWFRHLLPNSWKNPATSITRCSANCSSYIKTDQQLKGYVND